MDLLLNIALATLPVLSFWVFLLICAYLAAKGNETVKTQLNKYKTYIVAAVVLTTLYTAFNSPLLRPVNTVHDKVSELTPYRSNGVEPVVPELDDNSRKKDEGVSKPRTVEKEFDKVFN